MAATCQTCQDTLCLSLPFPFHLFGGQQQKAMQSSNYYKETNLLQSPSGNEKSREGRDGIDIKIKQKNLTFVFLHELFGSCILTYTRKVE